MELRHVAVICFDKLLRFIWFICEKTLDVLGFFFLFFSTQLFLLRLRFSLALSAFRSFSFVNRRRRRSGIGDSNSVKYKSR